MRKLVTIRIDPEVWQAAREMGLNISRLCENALKIEIQDVSNAKLQRNCRSPSVNMFQHGNWRRVWDLNPRGHMGHRLSRLGQIELFSAPLAVHTSTRLG